MNQEPSPNPVGFFTEVRPSPVHNMGIFATRPIPRGAVWWQVRPCDVIPITRLHFEILTASAPSPATQGFIQAVLEFGYYLEQHDALFFIPDNGRYLNHSFQPNSVLQPGSGGFNSIALRDIEVGEEIFEDYTRYDKCPWARLYGEFGQKIGCWQASKLRQQGTREFTQADA